MNRELIAYRAGLDTSRAKSRDYDNQEVAEMAQYLLTVLDDRAALAAHAKELRRHIFSNIKHKEGCPGSWDEDCTCGKSTILRQDTETSLARLIAGKQAEALRESAEAFAKEFQESSSVISAEQAYDWILNYAQDRDK